MAEPRRPPDAPGPLPPRTLGFILQQGYRLEQGKLSTELWCVSPAGLGFLVRERRARPHGFVRSADLDSALVAGEDHAPLSRAASPLRTLRGEPVERLEFAEPRALAAFRERLDRASIESFEADLRFPMQALLERGIRSILAVQGEPRIGSTGLRVYEDPGIAPACLDEVFEPPLRVLSLDLETDPGARRVLSAALHGAGVAEVLLVQGGKGGLPAYATECPDEASLLEQLAARIRALDPDVLTGWNVVGFDLAVLERRARELGVGLELGRVPGPLAIREALSYWSAPRAFVEGRQVLDGIGLLSGAAVRTEDRKLETVARAVLGEGKTLTGPDRAGQIESLFLDDREAFCAYNLKDAELVSRILEKTGALSLAIRRSLLTGLGLDRVGSSIACLDALYLPELRRRGFVARSVPPRGSHEPETEPTAGGAVLEPRPGLHERVLVFDFKSLYPSLMRTFNIDPLGHVPDPRDAADLIRTPGGAAFRREPGILPAILDELMQARARAREQGDPIASQATKILMNSFYGVLAAPSCRFHSAALANAVTLSGQALLFWTKRHVEQLGLAVLYGDTDSLFVASAEPDTERAVRLGGRLVEELNAALASRLLAEHGVSSRLELELEGLFEKLFFPPVRHGAGGARKRYAGLWRAPERGRPELLFVGMESVRRDSTEAAKRFQRGLYARLFAGEPLEGFIRDFVGALRRGELDGELVYRKALSKSLESYTETTPPHVQAARLEGAPGRLIEYRMTTRGPEPLSALRAPIDHAHYVEKQLRPIAEAVIGQLGLDWDELVGNPRQLRLF